MLNILLRNFFYAFGLIVLWALSSMNPATAQFKDLLSLLHVQNFWTTVALVTALLLGLELALGGLFSGGARRSSGSSVKENVSGKVGITSQPIN